MERQIYANFDDEGIWVYQAFKPSIADAALKVGTFDKGFNLERMTWIKPSFGWMLYRSGYGTKRRQERILKIKLTHNGFISILKQAIPTAFDPNIFTNEHQWRSILDRNEVRYQWDPDRDLFLQKLSRRAIQIGIEGDKVKNYVDRWIIAIEDVTELAANIRNAVNNKSKELPPIPDESIYCVAEDLKRSLGIKSR